MAVIQRVGSPAKPRKWMSVHEMGDMLGLKKTDRYWLVHKNYFRTETLLGKMRVEIASFEKCMPIRTGITKSMEKHREKS